MPTAYVDSLPSVRMLLTTNWNAANTGSVTPIFLVSDDEADTNLRKRYDIGESDLLLIYKTSRTEKPGGIGRTSKEVRDLVTLDIRTATSRAHHIRVVQELDRILDLQIVSPFAGYPIMYPNNWTDFSDKNVRIWRDVRDIELVNYALVRGTA